MWSIRSLAPSLMCAALLFASASCGDDDAASKAPSTRENNTELLAYLKTQFGTRLVYLDGELDFVVDEESDATTAYKVRTEVDGFGSREVYIEEIVSSAAKGGGVLLHLEDLDSGETRFFDYDVADNYIAFGQDLLDPSEEGFKERGAAVSRLEDGRYTVWTFDDEAGREDEQTVADGYAALQLVNEYAEFSDISLHLKMTAVAMAHAPTPEARNSESCETVDNTGANATALRPPVCTIFKEFCDCAACDVLGRTGPDCDLCPALE